VPLSLAVGLHSGRWGGVGGGGRKKPRGATSVVTRWKKLGGVERRGKETYVGQAPLK